VVGRGRVKNHGDLGCLTARVEQPGTIVVQEELEDEGAVRVRVRVPVKCKCKCGRRAEHQPCPHASLTLPTNIITDYYDIMTLIQHYLLTASGFKSTVISENDYQNQFLVIFL
jgi:hypothetical protein